MEAIVLAGGFGTRLRSVVSDVPKPMAPVCGKPFLDKLLSKLAKEGFSRVVLSIGYLGETIVEYFGTTFQDMDIVYELENTPQGTGGAIQNSLKHCLTDHVFIFNGDTYLDLEVAEVEALWQKFRNPIIVARHLSDTARYGRLQIQDQFVTGFLEKAGDGAGFINAGCYVFPTDLLANWQSTMPFSIEEDFLSKEVSKTPFRLFTTEGMFIDIGVPDDYRRAQIELDGK